MFSSPLQAPPKEGGSLETGTVQMLPDQVRGLLASNWNINVLSVWLSACSPFLLNLFEFGEMLEYVKYCLLCMLVLLLAKCLFYTVFLTLHVWPMLSALALIKFQILLRYIYGFIRFSSGFFFNSSLYILFS